MVQEFIVGSIKIMDVEGEYEVSVQQEENGGWEVIASFKYAMDAVNYFNNIITNIGMAQNEQAS